MSKLKNARGFLYGLALAIAVSAGAATVYNYFPPPGMTYSPTTGLVVGTAMGGAEGAGTINTQGLFVNGASALTTASVPGSNTQVVYNSSGSLASSSLFTFTSGSVVLNLGAATTPGTYSVGSLDSMVVNGVIVPIPGFALNSNIQGVFENHSYVNGVAAGGARYYGVRSEGTISSPLIVSNGDHLSTFYAAGYNGSTYSLGGAMIFQVNGTPGASAMPTDLLFQLSPTGSQTPATVMQLYHDAGVVVGAPTGGDQGAGTINMQGCFVNGVACSTGGASGGNPTGTVGLTAVNGVAGTYMRSDAAPPLSQAISPTWTGTHLFNGALITGSTTAGWSFGQSTGLALARIVDTTGTTGNKAWQINTNNTGTHLNFRVTSDDFATTVANWLDVTRSGAAVSDLSFGNATNNPTYTFLGTGAATFGGNLSATGTGGNVAIKSAANVFTVNQAQSQSSGAAQWLLQNAGTTQFSMCLSTTAGACFTGDAANDPSWQSNGTYRWGNIGGSSVYASLSSSGVINVKSGGDFQVNGTSIVNTLRPRLSWSGTCSGSGCITGVSNNVTSVTRNSAGNYTVNETSGIGSSSVCEVSIFGSVNAGLWVQISSVLASTINVLSVNSTGTQTDILGFSIVCFN